MRLPMSVRLEAADVDSM